jgi:glycosyltransferase involved in cell wall biosynthesis
LKSDITFSWFAGDHAAVVVFFSKLFRKKSIVIVGGGDVAYVPEINYGQFTLSWRKQMLTKFALKYADIVLPVSEFTKNEVLKRCKPKAMEVVCNGVNTERFKPIKGKENKIVTIGKVTEKGIKLKGLETFARASTHFLEYKFIIIGKNNDLATAKLKKINPNLVFTGQIPHKEVLKWLQRAKIYCQLSYVESFGMGVAEAMSCDCIPVVAERGALPEVVGDTGFYVPYGDEKATAEAIKKALNAPDDLGKRARERIREMFPIERRKKELVKIINDFTS